MGCENERGRLRYNNEGYPYPATGEAGTVEGDTHAKGRVGEQC